MFLFNFYIQVLFQSYSLDKAATFLTGGQNFDCNVTRDELLDLQYEMLYTGSRIVKIL